MTQDISALRERRADWKSLLYVGANFGFVFAPMFVAAAFGGWETVLLAFVWFGASQNSIANLMHETAHRHLFRSAKWSDTLGNRVLAPFFLTSFELYRRRHWVHHNQVGGEHDTKTTYRLSIQGGAGLAVFLMRCLLGVEAVKRFRNTQTENKYVKQLTKQQKTSALIDLLTFQTLLAAALFLVAYISVSGNWLSAALNAASAYGVVYIYGMISCTVFLSTLRGIAEHQVIDPIDAMVGHAAMRNMLPTPITRIIFGSYGFCEHATHHEHPAIPYYNLRAATRLLAGSEQKLAYGRSYWGVIGQVLAGEQKKGPQAIDYPHQSDQREI
jgi:fatty acid desaturase